MTSGRVSNFSCDDSAAATRAARLGAAFGVGAAFTAGTALSGAGCAMGDLGTGSFETDGFATADLVADGFTASNFWAAAFTADDFGAMVFGGIALTGFEAAALFFSKGFTFGRAGDGFLRAAGFGGAAFLAGAFVCFFAALLGFLAAITTSTTVKRAPDYTGDSQPVQAG